MSQTQARLLQLDVLKFFSLQEIDQMLSDSSHQFIDHCRGSSLNRKSLVDRTGQLDFADSQLH